jgi:hypothetical protein
MKTVKKIVFTIALIALASSQSWAQCAMCRAVAEDAVDDNGFGIAAGLNSGIVFLMGIPYILLAVLFLVFFRKQIGGFWRSFNNIH